MVDPKQAGGLADGAGMLAASNSGAPRDLAFIRGIVIAVAIYGAEPPVAIVRLRERRLRMTAGSKQQ